MQSYLNDTDPQKSLDDNLISMLFEPSGRLLEEPGNLLKQDLNNPAVYQSLLHAIAGGASRLNELSQAVGKDSAATTAYVNQLIELGIVLKETPLTEKPGRKTIYRIEDSMFRFWYLHVMPAISMIAAGQGSLLFRKKVKPLLNDFMEPVFEQMAKEYLLKLQSIDKLPFLFSSIGRWWGNDPVFNMQTEIDIIADGGDEAIFAECKWKNEPMPASVFGNTQASSITFSAKETASVPFLKIRLYKRLHKSSKGLRRNARDVFGYVQIKQAAIFCNLIAKYTYRFYFSQAACHASALLL